jgi:hypothetical protein
MSKVRQMVDRLALKASYRRVFETPDGKRVLRHLMRVGFVTKSTFVVGDPHQSAMNEGSRRMVLSIINFVVKDYAELENYIEETLNETTT